MKKKISLLGLLTVGLFTHHLNAQIVGTAAYMPGYYVGVGIAGEGGFEGADTIAYPGPPGLHPRSNTSYLGFVANPQLDGWVNFNGDFFTPGTPENGWGIELGSAFGTKASNNRASPYEIIGSVTNFQYLNGCYIVDWDGNYVGGGYNVHVSIRYQLKQDDLFYTTSVKIINNGASTIPEVYYYRNVDPDNNIILGGTYSTQNTIVSQPNGVCGKALVSAEQFGTYLSYMGFAAIGPDYRVSYGGFSNRDASDIWTGTGFVSTVGSTAGGDQAISLAHRTLNVAPGDTANIRFVVVLDAAQAENAISSLFYFDYEGGLGAPKPLCSNFVDTALSCPGKVVHIELEGQNVNDFTWSWSPATALDTTQGTIVNASPSTTTLYTITGTPVGGCFTVPIIQQIVVAMDTATNIEFNIDVTNPICANNNGALEVIDLVGGIGPVTIEWTGGPTTPLYDNLFSGIYEVVLTDSFGCFKDSILYLENITTLTGTVTIDSLALCDHPSGQFTAVAANGAPVYGYDIGIASNTTGVFSGLPAGYYVVGISDQNGCLIFEPVTIADTSLVNITATPDPENCGGGNGQVVINVTNGTTPITYTLGATTQTTNAFGSLDAGTYEAFIQDNYGCTDSVTFTITNVDDLDISVVSTIDDECSAGIGQIVVAGVDGLAPYAYNMGGSPQPSGTFSGLNAGTYTVTVTGGTCTESVNVTLANLPSTLTINIDEIIDENCGADNGQMLSTAANGTTPYTYVLSGGPTQTNGNFTGLEDGIYTITVTDSIGCINSITDTVGQIPITIELGDSVLACNSYTIQGDGVGAYLWSTGETTNSISVNQNGTYWLMVSMPEPGCMDMDTVKITFLEDPAITPPNVFTPNGDGHNEKFVVDGIFVTTYSIKVFNRWGLEVFSASDINNSWDGTTKSGADADEGVYMYIIEYDNPCESPTLQTRHGSIQLLR